MGNVSRLTKSVKLSLQDDCLALHKRVKRFEERSPKSCTEIQRARLKEARLALAEAFRLIQMLDAEPYPERHLEDLGILGKAWVPNPSKNQPRPPRDKRKKEE